MSCTTDAEMVQPVEPAHVKGQHPMTTWQETSPTPDRRRASRSRPGCRTSGWRRSASGSPSAASRCARSPARRSASATRPATAPPAACRVVLVQCSGLGNSLNAIGSLVIPYGFGFPVVLSMRGTLGERNPAQMPLGRTTVAMLEALGVQPFPLRVAGRRGQGRQGRGRVADGARVLAPILLEAELELEHEPDRHRPHDPRRRARRARRLVARHRRPPRCAPRATTARISTWAARWAPRSPPRSASRRSSRSARWSRSSATARR